MINLWGNAIPLDTNFIIKSLLDGSRPKTTEFNAILHRVFLDRVGKPIWDYTTIEELGRGLLAALAGLFLCIIYLRLLIFRLQVTVAWLKKREFCIVI
jgi:hypothetical protein